MGLAFFWVSSGHYLPKSQGGQTYFAPFSVRPKGMQPPRLSKIDTSDSIIHIYTIKASEILSIIVNIENTISNSVKNCASACYLIFGVVNVVEVL